MPLKTYSNLEQRIANLFASWGSWAHPDDDAVNPIPSDRPLRVLDLRNHATQAEAFRVIAQSILDHPGFADLSQEHQDDVNEFIAEMTTAVGEFGAVTEQEAVWQRLPNDHKRRAMDSILVTDLGSVPQEQRQFASSVLPSVTGKSTAAASVAAPTLDAASLEAGGGSDVLKHLNARLKLKKTL